jgi:hypothetical protein
MAVAIRALMTWLKIVSEIAPFLYERHRDFTAIFISDLSGNDE